MGMARRELVGLAGDEPGHVAIWAGLGAAVVIGALAGLHPAMRAARLCPTDALRSN